MRMAIVEKATIVLLGMVLVVTMAVNVYNGYTVDVLSGKASDGWEVPFFCWWGISFAASLLLFAVSNTMYVQEKGASKMVAAGAAMLTLAAGCLFLCYGIQ